MDTFCVHFNCNNIVEETSTVRGSEIAEKQAPPQRAIMSLAPVQGCIYSNQAIYRPEPYRFTPEKVPLGLCTHIFYAFAAINVSTFEARLSDIRSDVGLHNIAGINNLRKQQPGLKTLLAFGGWEESETGIYATLARNSTHRSTFVESAWKLANNYGFDGVDIHWLFPGADDRSNFVALIKELKDGSRGKLVTAAVAGNNLAHLESAYDVDALKANLDLVLVLTNYFHGGWEQTIGHVAAYSEATGAMDFWASKGFGNEKLVMGMAAYSSGWQAKECIQGGATSGLSPAGKYTKVPGFASYFELVKLGGKVVNSPEGPYLATYMHGLPVCFGFDDRQAILKKMNFITARGFAGAFSYTVDMDSTTFIVQRAINDGLRVAPPRLGQAPNGN